jgi:hypothetical protein
VSSINRGSFVCRAGLVVAGALWVGVFLAAPHAQQRGFVPMAASSVARFPDAHIGENVSMTAFVEAILSRTTFTVDQDREKTSAAQVLVIAPNLNGVLTPGTQVTVQGEVLRFDPAEVMKKAAKYTLDLPVDAAVAYRGKPAVLATAVIHNLQLVDLAKRVLPPPTEAELALDKAMKTISPTFNTLRTGLETPAADQLKTQIAALKTAFTETERFFKTRGTADATEWAQAALKFLATMEQGTAASRWEDVRNAATGLGGLCQQCHTAHRERMDDGSYRVRGGN